MILRSLGTIGRGLDCDRARFAYKGDMGIHAVGTGHVIHTDLGDGAGVTPGDVLTLYRDNGELPRINLGLAVVLTVEPDTSTAKIMNSVREIEHGDLVEIR